MMKTIMFSMVLALVSLPAFAGKDGDFFIPAATRSKHATTIERVELYLSGLTTVISEFTQAAPDGSIATGKFFMQRPGKMRWQYNPPTPVLMVSNGSSLVYYDYELEQVSTIPLDSSLISFLSRDAIAFEDDIGITRFEQDANMIRIQVAQREKPTEGKLQLEFSDKPLTLRRMVITDATGQVTTVALTDAKFGAEIKPELFVFKDPRKKRR